MQKYFLVLIFHWVQTSFFASYRQKRQKTMKPFPGWENIDVTDVTPEEIERSWNAVQKKTRPAKHNWRWMAAAAVTAVAISLPLALRRDAPVTEDVSICQVSATRGERKDVILPDGTRAVLNAESVLIYPERFGDRRSVFLSGEASFDVTSDTEHPFYVRTADVTVRVHGTRFDVNAYFNEPSVKTTLVRGAVTVWPEKAPERAVSLQPNQYFEWDRETGAITTASVDASEAIAWENGSLCWRSASLGSVIRTLERRFAVSIHLASGKYDGALITANFTHGESLDELLEALCMIVPGLHYTRENQVIYLK